MLGEHGRGGLGKVSRAHDLELGRDVAIKELLSRSAMHEVRFMREALITARLEHPGIVPVHEAGRWPDGTPFYAMKLVAGRPLRDLLAERKTVDERIGLLHHVIAVADAIAYAHGRNIIHRDLKPGNVIVGDFGETVVIDWGLAKDLSGSEESTTGGSSLPVSRDDDLTSAGTVFGTPAYMAPEQKRGESVDQRADVYAIGAMLWELCSLEKLPPGDSRQQRRILRRSGVEQDLIAIIAKASDPDLEKRYTDAGALAADLKAFTAGARIAARRYSLWAMIVHRVRQHRTLALAAAAMLMFAAIGAVLYVRSITVERNRANASEGSAKRARADAQASLDALTLKHAELLMATDPSAALDALNLYRGDHADQAQQIRSAAIAQGVATLRATPHTDNVLWVEGTPDGVISLGLDGKIMRTLPGGTSVVLTRGVSPAGLFAYSAARELLLYECNPDDLCALDISTEHIASPLRILRGIGSVNLSFSANGSKLATISRSAVLQIFDISDLLHINELVRMGTAGGSGILFVGENAVVVASLSTLTLVHLRRSSRTEEIPIANSTAWDAAPNDALALGTDDGQAYVVETSPRRISRRATICHGIVSGIKFIPRKSLISYACKEGTVGTWDFRSGAVTPRTHLDGHADRIVVSTEGDYIIAAGGNGTVTIFDLVTEIATSYKGHSFRLMTMSPPSPRYPFFLSGDVRGAIRTWPRPLRHAHLVAHVHRHIRAAFFSGDVLIATTTFPELITYSSSIGVHATSPHLENTPHLAHTADRRTFATYGSNDSVEIWSAPDTVRKRVISTNHGIVSRVSFIDDTGAFVSSGRDGRLVSWSQAGDATELAHLDQPIESFALGRMPRSAFMISSDGGLWRTTEKGDAIPLSRGTAAITRIESSPDRRSIFISDADGNVSIIDTESTKLVSVLHTGDAIHNISFNKSGDIIALSANNGSVHVGVRDPHDANPAAISWNTLRARARDMAFTTDGLLIAACTDGSILIYSVLRHKILFTIIGTFDLIHVAENDTKTAAILDTEGRVIWVDLDAIRTNFDKDDST